MKQTTGYAGKYKNSFIDRDTVRRNGLLARHQVVSIWGTACYCEWPELREQGWRIVRVRIVPISRKKK